jgi:hypothetical protein
LSDIPDRLEVPEFYQQLASLRLLAAKAANEYKNLSKQYIQTQMLKQDEYQDMMMAYGRQAWAGDPPPISVYKYYAKRPYGLRF